MKFREFSVYFWIEKLYFSEIISRNFSKPLENFREIDVEFSTENEKFYSVLNWEMRTLRNRYFRDFSFLNWEFSFSVSCLPATTEDKWKRFLDNTVRLDSWHCIISVKLQPRKDWHIGRHQNVLNFRMHYFTNLMSHKLEVYLYTETDMCNGNRNEAFRTCAWRVRVWPSRLQLDMGLRIFFFREVRN